jgi:DHA2 family multidrug resistance protein
MRNLGGAIGIAVCATILNDRTNLHFERLAEHLNPSNVAMLQMLNNVGAKFAAANGGDVLHGHAAALQQLWSLTYREARVLTFADAFLFIGVCLAVATLLTPLMKKVATPATAPADAH